MTIKQQGGVFGRNPTFNDLTAETADFSSSALGSASATALTINSTTDRNVILRDNDAFSGADNQIKLAIAPSVVSGQSAGVAFGTFSNPQYWKQGIFWKRSSTFGIGDLIFAVRSTADTTTVTEADKKLTIARYGDVTVHSGNLVIGTSGKGIDFSATAGTGTSELFDDYEEGTWTPALQSYDGTPTTSGTYTKIGDVVVAEASIALDGTSDSSGFVITNPPFAPNTNYIGGGFITKNDGGATDVLVSQSGTGLFRLRDSSDAAVSYNAVGVSATLVLPLT